MRKLIPMLVLASAVFYSCKPKEAKPPVSQKKMELVLWDMMRADVYTSQFLRKDSTINDTLENIRLQQKIFNQYKISRKDFEQSYAYYLSKPEVMKAILDSILAKQSRVNQNLKTLEPL